MAKRCVVSWSGGKDSTLVLHRVRQQGLEVAGLLTMFSPETGTSRSHGLPMALLELLAEMHGLPLLVEHGSWADYEERFKRALGGLVQQGIDCVAFGDIFLDDHRLWVERVCAEVGCEALEPLWGESTTDLAEEVLASGYLALVCTVRSDRLAASWLGQPLDRVFLNHLRERDIDPCGEHGEYHTVVVSGPGMARRLVIDAAHTASSEHHHHWLIERWHAEGPERE
jgi:diphthine-ammonia ligase